MSDETAPVLAGASGDPAAEAVELRHLLTDVVVSADRMRDGWAEGDAAVRQRLWTNLHTAAEAAHDHVYPLATS